MAARRMAIVQLYSHRAFVTQNASSEPCGHVARRAHLRELAFEL
jgi:hypothetical protein